MVRRHGGRWVWPCRQWILLSSGFHTQEAKGPTINLDMILIPARLPRFIITPPKLDKNSYGRSIGDHLRRRFTRWCIRKPARIDRNRPV
ncbi:hypothetical protein C2E23DRAFT_471018 [Lenzites betulinus]|nr:hypothetical protein C2E23DRAFT_471018 [Lenzites betulinus]